MGKDLCGTFFHAPCVHTCFNYTLVSLFAFQLLLF